MAEMVRTAEVIELFSCQPMVIPRGGATMHNSRNLCWLIKEGNREDRDRV